MQLSQKQIEELWGEEGPYSEVKLVTEHRILDDSLSRIFLSVEIRINPFTFKVIKQNIKKFADDEIILQLIEHAENLGGRDGYLACAFNAPYGVDEQNFNEEVMQKALESLAYSKKCVIKMHKFVMDLISD